MPTPVGHALGGIATGALLAGKRPFLGPRRDLVLFALLAQTPDLDFLPGLIIGRPDAYHHGLSHSLGAALLVGLLTGLVGRRWGSPLRWGVMGFLICWSHVLLDALCLDTSYPYGVPLWQPLSAGYHLFYPLFPDVWRQGPFWALVRHNLWCVTVEVLVLGPPALLSLWRRRRLMAGSAQRDGDAKDG